jgi:hypothetical protein
MAFAAALLVALVAACGGGTSRTGTAAPSPSLGEQSPTAAARPGARPITRDSAQCPALYARRGTAAAAAPRDTTGGRGAPDIILCASVSAREVRFATQPQISVRLSGALGDSVHVLERRNLPRPVGAGTTYRDVFVAVEILGHLAQSCAPDSSAAADSTRGAISPSLCASIRVADSVATPSRTPP